MMWASFDQSCMRVERGNVTGGDPSGGDDAAINHIMISIHTIYNIQYAICNIPSLHTYTQRQQRQQYI